MFANHRDDLFLKEISICDKKIEDKKVHYLALAFFFFKDIFPLELHQLKGLREQII